MKIHTRRSFVKNTALITGGILTRPHFVSPTFTSGKNPHDKKLNVALCGLGNYAADLAYGLEESQYCRLAGIVTGHPEKAIKWKRQYNIPDKNIYDYQTFDRLADNPDIDLVYIVLPNGLHKAFTIRAAEAGKHVICEKPMATSVEDCAAMISACKSAGVQLAIGYRLHYEPTHLEIKRLGQQKIFGQVRYLETGLGYKTYDAAQAASGYRQDNPNQWRLNKKMAGGGPLMDLGIYCIQCSRYVLGEEPIAVSAQFSPVSAPGLFSQVEEAITWQLEFASGAVCHAVSSYGYNVDRFFATADEGQFELSPALSFGPFKGKTSKALLDFPVINQQAAQLDAIGKLLIENKPLPDHITGEEGIKDLRVIEAAYKAAESGRKIVIDK